MVSEFFALASAFAPPAPPATPPPPPPAVVTVAPPLPCPCAGKGSCSAAPPVVAAPPAAPPRLWQLRDASGQMWTHADRSQLESFVAARDAAMRPSYQFTYPVAAPSSCGPRGCR